MNLVPKKIEDIYTKLVNPLVKLISSLNPNPNMFTTFALFASIVAGYCFGSGSFVLAGVFTLLSGIFDTVDGKIARMTNRVTTFGALYDSTMDRYAEVIMFFGIGFYLIKNGFYITSVAAVVAIGGSMMVSYVRARAEGLGFECSIGLMRRAERILLLGFGALFYFLHSYFVYVFDYVFSSLNLRFDSYPPMPLAISLYIMAVFTNVTAFQRLYYVWKKSKIIEVTK